MYELCFSGVTQLLFSSVAVIVYHIIQIEPRTGFIEGKSRAGEGTESRKTFEMFADFEFPKDQITEVIRYLLR